MSGFEIDKHPELHALGISAVTNGGGDGHEIQVSGEPHITYCPNTGSKLGSVKQVSENDFKMMMKRAEDYRCKLAATPMPKRGEAIRQIGEALRQKKDLLAKLLSLEMGKIIAEAEGEVQEFIDMCDFAAGLSRSLAGQVIPSERKDHTIIEQWNPLGIVGVISAFNFPLAVFGWNFCLSFVCGNVTVWKGASSTSLITCATGQLVEKVLAANGFAGALIWMVGPGKTIGQQILEHPRISLISFTGSTAIGKGVAETVSRRFGKTILELGGNNALFVFEDADVEMALKAAVFAAVGTSGQRCTSLRRLYVHDSLFESFKTRLIASYKSLKIGDPLDRKTHIGPLHTPGAIREFREGLEKIAKQGGKVI